MLEFLGLLIAVLISAFAFVLALALFVGLLALPIGKWLAGSRDSEFLGRQSWRKIIAWSLGLLLLLCIEITAAIGLGVFKDDASLHCGPGTAYHYNGKNQPWTCELS